MTRCKVAHHAGRCRRSRGVSLIEALLALVVMSLGMLAVVGVQATLRGNGDLSRQRAEAVRLAQEGIETWRTFTSVNAVGGQPVLGNLDYTDIVSDGPIDVTPPLAANATYTRTRTVSADPPSGSPPLRTLAVTVQWTDRAGAPQEVQLYTTVARIAPAIAASLSVPPNGLPARQPLGRHKDIPRGALPRAVDTSEFTPPQPAGPVTSLVFNNTSGLITSICVDGVCVEEKAQLVSGYLRAAIKPAHPDPLAITEAIALNPQSTAQQLGDFLAGRQLGLSVSYVSSSEPAAQKTGACFSDPLPGNASTAIEYFCVVRLYATALEINPKWTGSLQFGPIPGVITDGAAASLPSSASLLRACRYKPASAVYNNISGPLSLQNFLLMAAGDGASASACPAAVTAAHQP